VNSIAREEFKEYVQRSLKTREEKIMKNSEMEISILPEYAAKINKSHLVSSKICISFIVKKGRSNILLR
jgi:hypothetical protein